ncbi:MAG: DUF952 domain-containing protein [Pyrinomonadaceae bacterium]|nr:DUF952 domain-containing protein [Pyrinomonadaceae bacterium]
MTEKTYIFHIVLPKDWKKAEDEDFYEAKSLDSEGFIHCSFAGQIEDVLERYYSNVETVVVLKIDPEKLTSKLVNEPSTEDEIYPHIYGPINRDAVIAFEYL